MTDFMPDPVDKVLRNIMLDLIQPFMNKFGYKFKFMTKYFWDRHKQFGSPGSSQRRVSLFVLRLGKLF